MFISFRRGRLTLLFPGIPHRCFRSQTGRSFARKGLLCSLRDDENAAENFLWHDNPVNIIEFFQPESYILTHDGRRWDNLCVESQWERGDHKSSSSSIPSSRSANVWLICLFCIPFARDRRSWATTTTNTAGNWWLESVVLKMSLP